MGMAIQIGGLWDGGNHRVQMQRNFSVLKDDADAILEGDLPCGHLTIEGENLHAQTMSHS